MNLMLHSLIFKFKKIQITNHLIFTNCIIYGQVSVPKLSLGGKKSNNRNLPPKNPKSGVFCEAGS